MADGFDVQEIGRQFTALPPARRGMLVATGAASLGFFLWIGLGQAGPSYGLLYRGLPEDEVARVVDVLDAERISYRLEDGGTSVFVPSGQVSEARIRVAGRGLPAGGGVGFEIFDRTGFGVTNFVQRVNYQRALQGELARSIEHLAPVERARVQLAIPESGTLLGRERKARASVVVKVASGRDLHPDQVSGIVHLVASSIQNLDPSSVSVVDNRGHLLSSDGGGGPMAGSPAGVQSHRRKLEKELADRIEAILNPPVGVGRVVARVSADLDWTHTETTAETFDPDSQIERSEQRSTETSNEGGNLAEGGVAGVAANDPASDALGAGPGTGSATNREVETINYELSKTISVSSTGGGRLERLSVAVLLDGKPGGADGEFVPWEAEELAQFEQLARQAVGFSEERGDEIVVATAPFHSFELPVEEEQGMSPDTLLLINEGIRWGALLIGVLLFGFTVIRPLARALGATSSGPTGLPARLDELESRLAMESGQSGGALGAGMAPSIDTRGVSEVVAHRQDESLQAVRTWMKGE